MKSREAYKKEVDVYLRNLLQDYEGKSGSWCPEFGGLLHEISKLVCRGGKRVRPYLTYLAYMGSGGKDEEAILPIAVSQDLYHNLLLIHDDIIDRDLVRYGGPNLMGVYAKEYARLGKTEAAHLAQSLALLAGDTLYSVGHQTILGSRFPAELRLAALQIMDEGIYTVAGGEVADVLLPLQESAVSSQRITEVCACKTAIYTFEVPLWLGVVMSGNATIKRKEVAAFAQPLGIAYQLKDDLLGIYGDEEKLGKPVLSDLREGKRTLLYSWASEKGSEKDAELLKRHYGCASAGEGDLQIIRQLFERTGAKAYVQGKIEAYIKVAEEGMSSIGLLTEVNEALSVLIDSCKKRET